MSYIKTKSHQPVEGFTDFLKSFGSGAIDAVTEYGKQQGQAEAYKSLAEQKAAAQTQAAQASTLPPWAIPAGIGAIALVAIIALKK